MTNMTSGKYFNKGVKALDAPHIGHVVRETPEAVIVFGGKQERYDIPIKEIQQVGANVLIGLPFGDIIKKYTVSRKEPLPARRKDPWPDDDKVVDLATYEGKYPNSLFNRGVRANNEDDLGHIMKETKDRIVVFGYSNQRFDIPKSHIIAVGRNVILDINFPDIFKYEADRNAPLPSREPANKLIDDEGFSPPSKLVDEVSKAHYTQLITKEVLTNDRKYLGHVDGFDNTNIIVKSGIVNPQYYKIPRAKVDSYQDGKVVLSVTGQDIEKHFGIKYPGYLNDVSG
jgi:sporulation protein YlmC with PRC-barrel domain